MIKIAILNKYQGKVFRGAERFVEELSARLKKHFSVDVIADIGYLDLLKKRYDVVIPTNGRWQVIITRLITWLTGAKMIVSGQSGIGFDDRINLYSFPDTFVSLSTKAKIWAKSINPFVIVEYIPNGVDINKFTPYGEKEKFNLKPPIVLCVAALTKTKRVDLVIQAISRIPDASLVVVGKGPEEKSLKELGDRLLKGRFLIRNYSFDAMPKVYRGADVFTLVSEPYYSFEIVLVEAMSSGLPVIANDDPIRNEIVGNSGILVDPNNLDEYSNSLIKVLERKWGNIPRKQAENFDWDVISEKYVKLISDLFKNKDNE